MNVSDASTLYYKISKTELETRYEQILYLAP